MANWGDHYEVDIPEEPRPGRRVSMPVYATELGAMYCGLSEKVLQSQPLKELHGQHEEGIRATRASNCLDFQWA